MCVCRAYQSNSTVRPKQEQTPKSLGFDMPSPGCIETPAKVIFNMGYWKNFSSVNGSYLDGMPSSPGVYVIYSIDQFGFKTLVYIGSSNNIRKRIQSHDMDPITYSHNLWTPWGIFKDILIKVRSSEKYGDWLFYEARLIKKLRPPKNRNLNG